MATPKRSSPSRITRAIRRYAQPAMLLIGAALVIALDARFIALIRAGIYYNPVWLTFAIPVCATLIWLNIASFTIIQLWRVWRQHQAWKRPGHSG